jgi:N-acetylmuramoyl-L-alanine amidase
LSWPRPRIMPHPTFFGRFCLACWLLVCAGAPGLRAQPAAELAARYNQLATKYLVKSKELQHYYQIDQRGLAMYASLALKRQDKPECLVYWDELGHFANMLRNSEREAAMQYYREKGARRFTKSQRQELASWGKERQRLARSTAPGSLAGYRIAIDPGHIAGSIEMAKVEQRFVILDLADGTKISFCEGDLNLTTAQLLKQQLERLGADVLLTRPKPNQGAMGKTFAEWRRENLAALLAKEVAAKRMTADHRRYLLAKAPAAQIYEEYFLPEDLRVRASIINAYQPDLTVAIHYNGSPFPRRPWNKPIKENFNMVFMPGAFLARELGSPEARFDFLRMLVLDNLAKSAKFSKLVLDAFGQTLGVPPIPASNKIFYLRFNSLLVSQGVYARNLGLTRLVNSPICYGESLYQDNEKEARLLNLNQGAKKQVSPRVRQVAQAYGQAVLQYFGKKPPPKVATRR